MTAVTACQGTNPGPSRQSVRLPGSNDVPDKCPRSASQLCQVSLGTVGLSFWMMILRFLRSLHGLLVLGAALVHSRYSVEVAQQNPTAIICCSLLIGVVAAGWRQENSSWGWSSGSAEEGLGIDAA